MLTKFVDRLLELAEPHIFKMDNGDEFVDKKVTRMPKEIRAEPVRVSSLTGLVEYIMRFERDLSKEAGYFVQVMGPTMVRLVSGLDGDREREVLAEAVADVPQIPFGKFVSNEQMIIIMQSMFTETPADRLNPVTDRDLVLKFAGTVVNGSVKEYGDDGITQKATIRDGIASKSEAIVPNPCTLRPFRTFQEIEQPASLFIFRMKEDGSGGEIYSALFEADGGAWKYTARESIALWLQSALDGKLPVIS
mgnify:CR=1 FL=1